MGFIPMDSIQTMPVDLINVEYFSTKVVSACIVLFSYHFIKFYCSLSLLAPPDQIWKVEPNTDHFNTNNGKSVYGCCLFLIFVEQKYLGPGWDVALLQICLPNYGKTKLSECNRVNDT